MRSIFKGLVPLVLLLAGCSADERVVTISREAADRQAQQSREMAEVVNKETNFRQQMAELQNDLRADAAVVAKERDRLEAERRQIANQREWAAFWTPLLETIGIVVVVLGVLGYSAYVVAHGFQNDSGADQEVIELLLQEIVSDPPAAISQSPAAIETMLRLPAPAHAERRRLESNHA